MEKFIRRDKRKDDENSLEEFKLVIIVTGLAGFLITSLLLADHSGKGGIYPFLFKVLAIWYLISGGFAIVYWKTRPRLIRNYLLCLYGVGIANIISMLVAGCLLIDLAINFQSCDMIKDDSCYLDRILVALIEGFCVILEIFIVNFNIFLLVKLKKGKELMKRLSSTRYEHLV